VFCLCYISEIKYKCLGAELRKISFKFLPFLVHDNFNHCHSDGGGRAVLHYMVSFGDNRKFSYSKSYVPFSRLKKIKSFTLFEKFLVIDAFQQG